MKNVSGFVLLGVGVAAAFFLMRAKNVANVATFGFQNLKIQGSKIVISLAVNNPTSISLKFNSFVGQVVVKGKVIANITGFTPVIINANSQSIVNLNFSVSTIGLLQFGLAVFNANNFKNLKPTLKGTANINGAALPVVVNLYE